MSFFKILRRTMSNTSIEEIKKFHKLSADGFEGVLQKLNIIKCEDGKCLAELHIEKEHTNPMKGLHGGLSATLVDILTTYALLTHEKAQMVPTVSVDIHISYLKGAVMGDTIIIDAGTLRAGKTLAYLQCEIRNKSTGDLLVKGSHTKYLMRSEN